MDGEQALMSALSLPEEEKVGNKEREPQTVGQTRQCSENTLHIVLHLPAVATATTEASASNFIDLATSDYHNGIHIHRMYKTRLHAAKCGTERDYGVQPFGYGTESGTDYWKFVSVLVLPCRLTSSLSWRSSQAQNLLLPDTTSWSIGLKTIDGAMTKLIAVRGRHNIGWKEGEHRSYVEINGSSHLAQLVACPPAVSGVDLVLSRF